MIFIIEQNNFKVRKLVLLIIPYTINMAIL